MTKRNIVHNTLATIVYWNKGNCIYKRIKRGKGVIRLTAEGKSTVVSIYLNPTKRKVFRTNVDCEQLSGILYDHLQKILS